MKDGTQYEMLRVEYITGSIPERQYTEDGGVIEDLDALGDLFVLCVRNFVPDPEETVYASGAEVPLSVLEKDGSAHVQAGDCVVTAFVEMAAPREVLEALKTVS